MQHILLIKKKKKEQFLEQKFPVHSLLKHRSIYCPYIQQGGIKILKNELFMQSFSLMFCWLEWNSSFSLIPSSSLNTASKELNHSIQQIHGIPNTSFLFTHLNLHLLITYGEQFFQFSYKFWEWWNKLAIRICFHRLLNLPSLPLSYTDFYILDL